MRTPEQRERLAIYASIFVTGAAVLVLEVAATRILSPYYGNTIYTVSSVLGVVLAALAIGYRVGGTIADRAPEAKRFFTTILFGGIACALVFGATAIVLPVGGYFFSLSTGPLIWSLVLFALPSFLLALLSPLAIAILAKERGHDGIGTISGHAFFWSTAGSITGSFGAGFFLIPQLGIRITLFALFSTLLLLGAAGLYAFEKKRKRSAAFLVLGIGIAIALGGLLLGMQPVTLGGERTIYRADGVYEALRVADGTYRDRPARFLYQDRSSSAAMFLDGDDLAFEYTKYLDLVRLFDPDPERALFIGGGAYSMPKEMFRTTTSTAIETIEIEPSLPEIAREYFNLPDSPRMMHTIADGRRYLHDSTATYDLIYSDVYYSLYSIPAHVATREFFELAKSRLSDDGVFLANLIGRVAPGEPSFIASEWKTFRDVFPDAHLFAVDTPSDLGRIQNFVIMGTRQSRPTDLDTLLAPRAAGFPFLADALIHEITIDEAILASAEILTDDKAPTDLLIAEMLSPTERKQKAEPGPKASATETVKSEPETTPPSESLFLSMVKAQLDLGARHIGTPGHDKLVLLIAGWLKETGAKVETDTWQEKLPSGTYTLTNVIGRFNPEAKRRIIIGTHFDTKAFAEEESSKMPVPGANDGASGTAVLFALAAKLGGLTGPIGVDLVFFDGEEYDPASPTRSLAWHPLGSNRFAKRVDAHYPNGKPEAAIVIDMVCDTDLHFLRETSSMRNAKDVTDLLWKVGGEIAPDAFAGSKTISVHDDHLPLQRVGVPAALLIDLDYDAWHTERDTIDRCSEKSMQIVLETLEGFLKEYADL